MTSVQIEIKNIAFNPQSITIVKGDTVTWTNNDTFTHTVTSDIVPPIFDSEPIDIPAGQQFQYTFNTPGTYNYHCEIHTTMHGTIIVNDITQPSNSNSRSSSGTIIIAIAGVIGLLYILSKRQIANIE